ncbi:HAD family phosphatase [Viridibacillus sp. YIM B01967]|uniref:HAD family phosphatase n=1 Tax=Viridibacillus soli TaxID=2798301 RepID=A0ABS1H821_9BACL|nr:Cof-type HAD-IIB family hydrolase [Viridibacillus soli]MBK3495168.1 HAD family phosphatase [Viridibacillus soli]
MSIQLIALDMDGTTLTPALQLTKKTIETIKRAIDRNVEVVICTGRTLDELEDVFLHLPFVKYVIAGNGSAVWNLATKEKIYENTLSLKQTMQILQLLEQIDLRIEAFADGKVYIRQHCYDRPVEYGAGEFAHFIIKTRTPVPNIHDFITERNLPIDKFNLYFKKVEERAAMWNQLEKLGYSITTSFQQNVEVNSSTANKGNALKELSSSLNMTSENVMAIGDAMNDLSMLKFAGLPIAMGNAVPAVKEIAQYITDTNSDEGVAKAIEKFILK